MGAAVDCGRRRPDGDPDVSAAAAIGYYYAVGFNCSNGNVDGWWKVVSYALLSR
jgi:hypothetical protein